MDAASLRDLGQDLFDGRQYERALGAFAEGVRRVPSDHRARISAARCLIRINESERAVIALHACAEGLLRRDYLLSAIAACKLALEVSPKERLVLDTLARVYSRAVRAAGGKAVVPPPAPEPLVEGHVDQDLLVLSGEALVDRAFEVLASPDDGGQADPDARPPLPLFADLDLPAFVDLVALMQYRDVPPEHPILVEGQAGDALYVVVAGAAEVTRTTEGESEPQTLGFLRGGSIFGEVSLLTGAPSTASVTAVSATEVFEIRREHLNQVARLHPKSTWALGEFVQERMTRNLIAGAPLFQQIPQAQRPEILKRFRFRALAPGEKVLSEGEKSPGLFLVLAGELVVQKEDPAGGSVTLGVLREGEVAGEISLVTGLRASATVSANRKTAVMVLDRAAFDQLSREQPEVRRYLEGLSDRRLKQIREALRPAEIIDADALVVDGQGDV